VGAAIKTIRDRRNLYEDRQADAAMHVRTEELKRDAVWRGLIGEYFSW
jgi:hypothetical protein